jgi:hypothetical protein
VRYGRKKQRGMAPASSRVRLCDQTNVLLAADLQSFRRALATLQAHVDDLDALKATHYIEVLEGEQDAWETIASKVSLEIPLWALSKPNPA